MARQLDLSYHITQLMGNCINYLEQDFNVIHDSKGISADEDLVS